MHTNVGNPVTWSFVVRQNPLTWNTILANQTQDIEFTVPSGIAIGKYFATVSVRAAIGIDTPLDISVSAEGQRPDWSKPEGYNDYMTVVAQIKLDGIVSTDPDDMLGAFTDPADGGLGECLGAAQPTYNESRDAYYVRLMVYGNSTIVAAPPVCSATACCCSSSVVRPRVSRWLSGPTYAVPPTDSMLRCSTSSATSA